MKKFVENVKRYIQYRRNRRFVKMKMLEYEVEALRFINGIIEEKYGDSKHRKIGDIGKSLLESLKMVGYQAEKAKKEGR